MFLGGSGLHPTGEDDMALELRRGRDGTLRPTWYGRYEVNGKRYAVNLGVKIAGTPPASLSLREKGDSDFECSRTEAKSKLEQFVENARRPQHSAHLVERIYEIKTGERVKSVALDNLPEQWASIPRRRKPNPRYAAQAQSTLKRFVAFMQTANPKAGEIAHVTRALARSFMEAEEGRGVTAKTWNDTLKLLRATCKRLMPAGSINPFYDLPTRDVETVFRKPFTPAELKAIIEEAHKDDFIRPVLVTGICTAMRRGDCCLLKWDDVDLEDGFITVKTSKTGETVDIPIFPLLRDVLEAADKGPRENLFCFPEAAAMYAKNPDGITWRVKQVLTEAFRKRAIEEGKAFPVLPEDEVRRRGASYLDGLGETSRTARMREVFDLYMAGKNINEVMAETGLSRGSVSGHLNDIEQNIRCAFIRGKVRGTASELLQNERANGTRRASVRDFHSFRVSWITLALEAGVPLEIVQRVTGHRTADVVLKHYFRPGREDFRETIMSAMPELLTAPTGTKALPAVTRGETAGPVDVLEEALKALEDMNARNWKKQRDAATGFIRKAKEWTDRSPSDYDLASTRVVKEVREVITRAP
jgi:integrase